MDAVHNLNGPLALSAYMFFNHIDTLVIIINEYPTYILTTSINKFLDDPNVRLCNIVLVLQQDATSTKHETCNVLRQSKYDTSTAMFLSPHFIYSCAISLCHQLNLFASVCSLSVVISDVVQYIHMPNLMASMHSSALSICWASIFKMCCDFGRK